MNTNKLNKNKRSLNPNKSTCEVLLIRTKNDVLKLKAIINDAFNSMLISPPVIQRHMVENYLLTPSTQSIDLVHSPRLHLNHHCSPRNSSKYILIFFRTIGKKKIFYHDFLIPKEGAKIAPVVYSFLCCINFFRHNHQIIIQ